jgi:hypothetical protein
VELSTAQKTTLKTYIDANLAAIPNTESGAFQVAAALNVTASPDFWVWRSRVSKAEYTTSTSVDGTTFNWTGTGYITRSVGERDAFRDLFDDNGYADPSLANVRQAFADIFSGATAPAPANRTHLTTISRRKATLAEKLLAGGTGSTASPATMGAQGELTWADVMNIRNP